MTFKKILSSVAAAVMSLSVLAIGTSAAEVVELTADDFAKLADPDTTITVVYNNDDDKANWENLGFGASEGEAWRSVNFASEAGENTFTIKAADLMAKAGVTDASAITYAKFEGYNGADIVSVTYSDGAESSDESSTSEDSSTVSESTATGDESATTDETAPTDTTAPDTGVEGVLVVSGVAIVAAGALMISRKRK